MNAAGKLFLIVFFAYVAATVIYGLSGAAETGKPLPCWTRPSKC